MKSLSWEVQLGQRRAWWELAGQRLYNRDQRRSHSPPLQEDRSKTGKGPRLHHGVVLSRGPSPQCSQDEGQWMPQEVRGPNKRKQKGILELENCGTTQTWWLTAALLPWQEHIGLFVGERGSPFLCLQNQLSFGSKWCMSIKKKQINQVRHGTWSQNLRLVLQCRMSPWAHVLPSGL